MVRIKIGGNSSTSLHIREPADHSTITSSGTEGEIKPLRPTSRILKAIVDIPAVKRGRNASIV